MASAVRGVAALHEELVKAKENLKDVDENIKKLTGRDPGDNRTPQRRVSIGNSPAGPGGREARLFALARRSVVDEGITPPAKRRAVGGAFSRLGPRVGGPRPPRLVRRDSGDEEDASEKPSIQSSVVATPGESRRREDLVREQNKDEKGKARNRRMFGLLLGTLQKFKTEAKDESEKERQRKAIEEKLEEKAKEEKDNLRKERQNLFNDRKQKQDKLKRLEQKLELVQIHNDWEKETRRLMNFIRTKAKPHLYYLPKTPTSGSDKKLKETKKVLEGIIKDRQKHLEEEIEVLCSLDREDEPSKEVDVSMEQEPISVQPEEKDDDMDSQQPQVEVGPQEEEEEEKEEELKEQPEVTEKAEKKSPSHTPVKSPTKVSDKSPDATKEPLPVTPKPEPQPVPEKMDDEKVTEDKENKETPAAAAAPTNTKVSGHKRRWDNKKREDKKVDVNKPNDKNEENVKLESKDVVVEKKRRWDSTEKRDSTIKTESPEKNMKKASEKSKVKKKKRRDSSSSSSSSSGSSSGDSSSGSSSSSSSEDESETTAISIRHNPEDIPFPDMPPVHLEDVPMPDEPDRSRKSSKQDKNGDV